MTIDEHSTSDVNRPPPQGREKGADGVAYLAERESDGVYAIGSAYELSDGFLYHVSADDR